MNKELKKFYIENKNALYLYRVERRTTIIESIVHTIY